MPPPQDTRAPSTLTPRPQSTSRHWANSRARGMKVPHPHSPDPAPPNCPPLCPPSSTKPSLPAQAPAGFGHVPTTPLHPKDASALDRTALHPGNGSWPPCLPSCLPALSAHPAHPPQTSICIPPHQPRASGAPGGMEVPLANWCSGSCLRAGRRQVLSRPHTWFSLRLQTPLAAGQARLTRDPALPGVQRRQRPREGFACTGELQASGAGG